MIKRHKPIAIIFMLIVAASGTIGYRYFKNKNVVYTEDRMMSLMDTVSTLNFLNFEQEALIEDGEYYLWFYDSEDASSQYLENEYINPMLSKLQVSEFENLIKVDFANCPFSVEKLKNKFNVKSKLAFNKAVVKNGKITYSDALSWDEDDPFSASQLKEWLYENNIWQSTYKRINSGN